MTGELVITPAVKCIFFPFPFQVTVQINVVVVHSVLSQSEVAAAMLVSLT